MSAAGELRTQIDAARALLAMFALDLENDDILQRDMVEGSTDLHDAIRHALARIVEIRALVSGINATLSVLGERGKRLEDQEERIRAALLTAMEVGGLQRLETPLGTVSCRAVPPSLVITDEAAIPDDFKVTQTPKLDRRAVLAALKDGKAIPGAELSNGGQTLQVRLG
jgi:hypothetical protein